MWDKATEERHKRWLEMDQMDALLKAELQAMSSSDAYDSFYKDLDFGTGGLRQLLGAGSNRLNIYTVRRVTQGIANYMIEQGLPLKTAIAYDSRINSKLFAENAAGVFSANGISVLLYDEIMPVPALSFAVRHWSCGMGVMITASHNPREYNGYKVYNGSGCQVAPGQGEDILKEIDKLDIFCDVKYETSKEGRAKGLVRLLGEETKTLYQNAVLGEAMEMDKGIMGLLSVVYTPLNGAGNKPVRAALDAIGIKELHIVKEQEFPDGNFPTCPYPNPEKAEAMELGISLCKDVKADLLLATDPDCDRLGVAFRENDAYRILTGNEVGALLLDFICMKRKKEGKMPGHPIIVRTLVTTRLTDAIGKAFGAEVKKVLTGFKFIGEFLGELEGQGRDKDYIFGFEESCGYLSGSYVRDKDGVNGAVLVCQMAAEWKSWGKTLGQRLEELYEIYGYYRNDLMEFTFPGEEGCEKIKRIMGNLRSGGLLSTGGQTAGRIIDYMEPQPEGFPITDMLEFFFESGTGFAVRPSGTEPKLKIYLFAMGEKEQTAMLALETMKLQLGEFIGNIG